MSDEKDHWFLVQGRCCGKTPECAGHEIWLRLERYGDTPQGDRKGPRRAVLLLHGASASHLTFTVPDVGLAPWLYENDFDPWLLDWRGSSLVVAHPENAESLRGHGACYNFNRAAQEDVPAAICKMRTLGVEGPISLFGHCMGAGVVAEAVALERVRAADVDRIVLSTLGLFYDAPLDSRLKSEERILERLMAGTGTDAVLSIDPRIGDAGDLEAPWPADLSNLYDAWPSSLRSHPDEPLDLAWAMCNRLSFMYGMPYHHPNLVPSIHVGESGAAELLRQFGAIPLQMYLHAAKNLRRGQATIFEPCDGCSSCKPPSGGGGIVSDDALARYHRLQSIMLITGALNRLWHRDSIDRMHEWLCRGSSHRRCRVHKQVFPTFGHQDLLWGTDAPRKVYPTIAAGLRADAAPPAWWQGVSAH